MFYKKIRYKMPLVLFAVIGFAVFAGPSLPVSLQSICYTLSLLIKEVLLFVLPAIIFSLLFGSIVTIGTNSGALRMILLLIPIVCISNFITTMVAYGGGVLISNEVTAISKVAAASDTLMPLFVLSLPKWIPNDMALFLGLLFGLFFSYKSQEVGNKLAKILTKVATFFLNNLFIPIIPIFILGFVLKLQHDDILETLIKNYAFIFVAIFALQVIYILFLFFVANKFRLKAVYETICNMLPASITGFSTMSSAAAMPLTLLAAEKNTKNPGISRFAIPTTVNIHLIGDCIAIPILAMAILSSFGYAEPSFEEYMIFAAYFVMAKFAVAAVPAGGILVMLPILERNLMFNSEMLSLITALYIMFDSVITSVNISGNSVFVMLFNSIYAKSKNWWSWSGTTDSN